ncbi:TPA: hypothetical protein O4E20_002323 [Proteus mirabilis]|uniref:Uncharacterized protein n=2 Tax=Proteus TaxID=583 RepID=A0AAJ0YAP1_PROMI|nr:MULTISPECIES: hypothetical protein [Proteus]EBA3246705.1 hypothetical protein [Salmonella enterica]NBM76102.1 hypothetical protein [Proteus sp. G4444]ARX34476.1 hypothetical protein AM402_10095 [Proteus mirabilis]ASB00384.1 hypothetical protein AM403_01320 [Proteus mirabilis]AUU13118.1 hypothetical protein MC53_003535 [Proteus mirabilis]
MNSISISAVLLAAIVLFASVFVVALASSLLLKKTLYGSLQQDNLSVSVAVRRTFMVSLVVALLLVYYFLSTTT